MKLTLSREALLAPLQSVMGVVERRQTLPILSNVLIKVQDKALSVTATDLEVELVAHAELPEPVIESGEVTLPGRKLMDICRTLPEQATIEMANEGEKMVVRSGRSRFTLATLPAEEFPVVQLDPASLTFSLPEKDLLFLTSRTHFAMAQQDVRYYLNGMLMELKDGKIRTIATDGHRLAFNELPSQAANTETAQVIIPRKGVVELMRLLQPGDGSREVSISVSQNHIRVETDSYNFTSKLIDGRYPDYEKVLPKQGKNEITLGRDEFKQAITRAAVLTNEKFRGICLQFKNNLLSILANNSDQEHAEAEISVDYDSDEVEIGLNANYLQDVLQAIGADNVMLSFTNADSSLLITDPANSSLFVVMPVRL